MQTQAIKNDYKDIEVDFSSFLGKPYKNGNIVETICFNKLNLIHAIIYAPENVKATIDKLKNVISNAVAKISKIDNRMQLEAEATVLMEHIGFYHQDVLKVGHQNRKAELIKSQVRPVLYDLLQACEMVKLDPRSKLEQQNGKALSLKHIDTDDKTHVDDMEEDNHEPEEDIFEPFPRRSQRTRSTTNSLRF